jgi:hypothetical protein
LLGIRLEQFSDALEAAIRPLSLRSRDHAHIFARSTVVRGDMRV